MMFNKHRGHSVTASAALEHGDADGGAWLPGAKASESDLPGY